MANYEDKKKGKSKIIFFILLLLMAGITTGALFAPTFDITEVKTFDGVNVTSGEILNSANINLGVNIFRINDFSIIKQIESLPYIKSAKLYRSFPSTIIIKYEEREPYAIVKYLESFAVIDKFSYVLEIKKENDLPNLPIIYGLDSEDCIVGKKLEGTTNLKYENCVYLLETALKKNFNYSISEINYDDSSNVKLYIKDKDLDVLYGEINIGDIEDKLTYLSSAIEKLHELGDKKGTINISSDKYKESMVFTPR